MLSMLWKKLKEKKFTQKPIICFWKPFDLNCHYLSFQPLSINNSAVFGECSTQSIGWTTQYDKKVIKDKINVMLCQIEYYTKEINKLTQQL